MPDHPVAWERGLPDHRLTQVIELQICADYRMKKDNILSPSTPEGTTPPKSFGAKYLHWKL